MAANPGPKVLYKIWRFSIITALLLSVLINTGVDISETGIVVSILEATARLFPSNLSWLVPTIATILTIVDWYYMVRQLLNIAENGIDGIVAFSTGFLGTLMVLLGDQIGLLLFGALMIAAGVIYIRFTE